MKNKEKKHSASQFPNIYRFITENPIVQRFKNASIRLLNQPKLRKTVEVISISFLSISIVILILGISISAISLVRYYQTYAKISAQRQNLQSQINFWQSIADKYDGYKDAYFRIALLEYQLSDFQKAKDFNAKALVLDPNFDDAKKLEAILDTR